MVNIADLISSIKPQIRDATQEARIRQLYDRAYAAYQKDRAQGIKRELESDWANLRTKFNLSLEEVKKKTGLF